MQLFPRHSIRFDVSTSESTLLYSKSNRKKSKAPVVRNAHAFTLAHAHSTERNEQHNSTYRARTISLHGNYHVRFLVQRRTRRRLANRWKSKVPAREDALMHALTHALIRKRRRKASTAVLVRSHALHSCPCTDISSLSRFLCISPLSRHDRTHLNLSSPSPFFLAPFTTARSTTLTLYFRVNAATIEYRELTSKSWGYEDVS